MTGIQLRVTMDSGSCGYCGGEVLAIITFPVEEEDDQGAATLSRKHALCQRCDIARPAAGALIMFFTVHGELGSDDAEEFAGLVEAWLSELKSMPDPAVHAAEWEAWRRGDFDESTEPPPDTRK